MLTYYQIEFQEQTSVKLGSQYKVVIPEKHIWKCCLQNGNHFVWAPMYQLMRTMGYNSPVAPFTNIA